MYTRILQRLSAFFLLLAVALTLPITPIFAQSDQHDWIVIEVQKVKILHLPWWLKLKGANLKTIVIPLLRAGQTTMPSIYNQRDVSVYEGDEILLQPILIGVNVPSSSDTVDFRLIGVDTDLSPDDMTFFHRKVIDYSTGLGQGKVEEYLKVRPGGMWSVAISIASQLGLDALLTHISQIDEAQITLKRNDLWTPGVHRVQSVNNLLEFTYEVRALSANASSQPATYQHTVHLDNTAWNSGYTRADGIYGGRTAQWVYGSTTQYDAMQTTFDVVGVPTGVVDVTVEGMDSENVSKTPIQVTVNGHEVYKGDNPLPNDDVPLTEALTRGQWGNYTWHFPGEYLHPGSNTIRIRNVAAGQISRPPFFMLDYADLTYTSVTFATSQATHTYQVMAKNVRELNLTLDSVTVTPNSTVLTFNYTAIRDSNLFIKSPGAPDAFYLWDRSHKRRYELREVLPSNTNVSLSKGSTYAFILTFDRIDDDLSMIDVIEGQHTSSSSIYWDFLNIPLITAS